MAQREQSEPSTWEYWLLKIIKSFCASFTPFTSPGLTVILVTLAGSRFHMEKTAVGILEFIGKMEG